MKNKRNTIYKRFIRVIVLVDSMMIFLLWCGYSTTNSMYHGNYGEKFLILYKFFCIGILIVFSIILTIVFKRIMKSLRVNFKLLIEVTRKMAAGNTDIEIPYDINDEFGDLYKEYKLLLNATREQSKLAEEVANSNLAIEIKPRCEDDTLGIALRKMVEQTNKSLSSIKESSEEVYNDSNDVAQASNNLAQGASEQASAIEEITASIAEVSEKTKSNANEAQEAAKLIDTAIESVNAGNSKMKEMIEAMKDINASSENIANIIKVIDDIAFQTNILALNAAVEAARAGEAGRGFAVVAEEVRTLAAKSAEAANQTSELIESAIKKTVIGSSLADETAEKFDVITSNVEKSAKLIEEISESSNNQALTIEQIDLAIDQVSKVIQNNTQISETCAEAANKLSSKASEMRGLISEYKLK